MCRDHIGVGLPERGCQAGASAGGGQYLLKLRIAAAIESLVEQIGDPGQEGVLIGVPGPFRIQAEMVDLAAGHMHLGGGILGHHVHHDRGLGLVGGVWLKIGILKVLQQVSKFAQRSGKLGTTWSMRFDLGRCSIQIPGQVHLGMLAIDQLVDLP